jgi:hypothetical protein
LFSEQQPDSDSRTAVGTSHGIKQPSVYLTAHLHTVQKLRIGGAAPPMPHINLWFTQGKKYLFYVAKCIISFAFRVFVIL